MFAVNCTSVAGVYAYQTVAALPLQYGSSGAVVASAVSTLSLNGSEHEREPARSEREFQQPAQSCAPSFFVTLGLPAARAAE